MYVWMNHIFFILKILHVHWGSHRILLHLILLGKLKGVLIWIDGLSGYWEFIVTLSLVECRVERFRWLLLWIGKAILILVIESVLSWTQIYGGQWILLMWAFTILVKNELLIVLCNFIEISWYKPRAVLFDLQHIESQTCISSFFILIIVQFSFVRGVLSFDVWYLILWT
jgi:hypothetical protein